MKQLALATLMFFTTAAVAPGIAMQPAAWRVALEDVAAQVHRGERLHAPRGVLAHRLGMVGAGVNRDHAEIAAGLHQAHRLARHAHADLHFGTDADPFDMR